MTMKAIYIIEDEEDILDLLSYSLKKNGYIVFASGRGHQGLAYLLSHKVDLLLLDLMLPEMHGVDICKTLRAAPQTRDLPIIMLTALGSEDDIVKGLDAGADDYITKPFSTKVLLSRVAAVLRRKNEGSSLESQKPQILTRYELTVNKGRFEVLIEGEKVELTYSEFHLLWILMAKPGWVFTRAKLVDLIRGEDHAITDRAVDVQIVGLRKKLGDYGKYVETVRGVGYRFKE